MADKSAIEWTDATFNPWVGCAKVSPGCAHCYAETWADRYSDGAVWGDDGVRRRTSAANWRKPLRWAELAAGGRLPDGSENVDGHRPRVFCASLADVFEPRPELARWRDDLFDLIHATPELDWLVLTKRPEVAADWSRPMGFQAHVWIGTSIENARFNWRADVLRQVPAAVRFISAEPLLGSLLTVRDFGGVSSRPGGRFFELPEPLDLTGIDWLIAGGESGPGHRPLDVDHVRELRDACVASGVAFYFKQHGGARPKSGGKLLDGREWCEMPRGLVAA